MSFDFREGDDTLSNGRHEQFNNSFMKSTCRFANYCSWLQDLNGQQESVDQSVIILERLVETCYVSIRHMCGT